MARKPRPSTSQSKRQMKRKRRDEYEKYEKLLFNFPNYNNVC